MALDPGVRRRYGRGSPPTMALQPLTHWAPRERVRDAGVSASQHGRSGHGAREGSSPAAAQQLGGRQGGDGFSGIGTDQEAPTEAADTAGAGVARDTTL